MNDHDAVTSVDHSGLLVDELALETCYERLRTATIGHLGVTVNALPVVVPVYFAVDGNSIVIRTSPGTRLSAAVNEAVVAFEVDHYDTDEDQGWSILVQGRAREITTSARLERARSLHIGSLTEPSVADRFIAVEMDIVTGRTIEQIRSGTNLSHP